jgi:hypothetical protein
MGSTPGSIIGTILMLSLVQGTHLLSHPRGKQKSCRCLERCMCMGVLCVALPAEHPQPQLAAGDMYRGRWRECDVAVKILDPILVRCVTLVSFVGGGVPPHPSGVRMGVEIWQAMRVTILALQIDLNSSVYINPFPSFLTKGITLHPAVLPMSCSWACSTAPASCGSSSCGTPILLGP